MKSRLKYLTVIALFSLQAFLITGCAHSDRHQIGLETFHQREDLTPEAPVVLATGTEEQIRHAAILDARADIATRRLRIAFTGSIASWPVGVPEKYFKMVEPYPRVPLPTGCTSSWLREARIYAEAYNQEILPYLIERKNSANHAKRSL